ncbi:hypothetical protein NQZ68_010294 [Dissostichus eleginoides]|nr:hypothetical protein NQZ68_010294 [Dissostichus eleginoides]
MEENPDQLQQCSVLRFWYIDSYRVDSRDILIEQPPKRVEEFLEEAKTRLREEGRVDLTQLTWKTCSQI